MRFFKIILSLFFVLVGLSSCVINDISEDYYESPVQSTIVEDYDLWYVDYHNTVGSDEIPFMQLAFTLSFRRGKVYANNNISGIGFEGNGLGIEVGGYSLYRNEIVANHELDGINSFNVTQIGENEIELYHKASNTRYFLIGYDTSEFDYDKLFYENIEYLLQDYEIWSKSFTSLEGSRNNFDYENFLSFTSENNRTFYSSKSSFGTNIDLLFWDYEGSYEVFDIEGYDNLKVLTLYYNGVNNEIFELTVLEDFVIELYHVASKTVYEFEGNYFIQYLKDGTSKRKERIERKRTKIKRQKINKISY